MVEKFSELHELTTQALIAAGEVENTDMGGFLGLKIGPYNAALYRRRKELGLTQQQLAKKIGMSKSYIGHVETLRIFPDPERITKLTEVLGINPCPDWLQVFTRERKQPAQVRVELNESDVSKALLNKAVIRDSLLASDANNLPKIAEQSELKEIMKDVLDSLSPRNRRVLSLRFGLEDDKELTLEEAGEKIGVGRERIRQIEAKSIRKLRHPSRSRVLKDFLEEEPDDPRNTSALMNGVINAIDQGNYQRAQENLNVIEERITIFLFPVELQMIESLPVYENAYTWGEKDTKDFIDWYSDTQKLTITPDRQSRILAAIKELNTLRHLKNKITSNLQKEENN